MEKTLESMVKNADIKNKKDADIFLVKIALLFTFPFVWPSRRTEMLEAFKEGLDLNEELNRLWFDYYREYGVGNRDIFAEFDEQLSAIIRDIFAGEEETKMKIEELIAKQRKSNDSCRYIIEKIRGRITRLSLPPSTADPDENKCRIDYLYKNVKRIEEEIDKRLQSRCPIISMSRYKALVGEYNDLYKGIRNQIIRQYPELPECDSEQRYLRNSHLRERFLKAEELLAFHLSVDKDKRLRRLNSCYDNLKYYDCDLEQKIISIISRAETYASYGYCSTEEIKVFYEIMGRAIAIDEVIAKRTSVEPPYLSDDVYWHQCLTSVELKLKLIEMLKRESEKLFGRNRDKANEAIIRFKALCAFETELRQKLRQASNEWQAPNQIARSMAEHNDIAEQPTPSNERNIKDISI